MGHTLRLLMMSGAFAFLLNCESALSISRSLPPIVVNSLQDQPYPPRRIVTLRSAIALADPGRRIVFDSRLDGKEQRPLLLDGLPRALDLVVGHSVSGDEIIRGIVRGICAGGVHKIDLGMILGGPRWDAARVELDDLVRLREPAEDGVQGSQGGDDDCGDLRVLSLVGVFRPVDHGRVGQIAPVGTTEA